ncbi:uncharacterized protein LOC124466350 isoform X2 [Hypomesus transpacificus]|uniref:uncharacterized protein LOC124466350 isoform X2 n=1 Tax=Hypomesus transpacificus TaxID=137520 RepID=UPI001F07D73D|nr:uncharacterized protein LOC124466350 isoform X2 [Hypomesus transpacificus]
MRFWTCYGLEPENINIVDEISNNTRVCSDHFPEESFTKSLCGIRKLKEGVVPTVFTWSSIKPGRRKIVRTASNVATTTGGEDALGEELDESSHSVGQDPQEDIACTSSEVQTSVPYADHDYTQRPLSLEEQLQEACKTVARQEEEISTLRSNQFLLKRFQCDDKQIQFYTGFRDYSTLKAAFTALQPTAEHMVRWSQAQKAKQASEHIRQGFNVQSLALIDQFFLYLCRVRLGCLQQDLANRFNVSQSTVSRICITWTNFLYFMLGSLLIWPSRESVNDLMPQCFKSTFPKTRVILDCTEIHVQKPSSKVLNSEIYSHYKGTTTLKSLIGISPSGLITFVSDLYTGSISDKEITRKSGILSLLEEGDQVMADKGFLIGDLLSDINVSLVIPPFLGPNAQFSEEEVRQTQEIARLRIHVERAIRRIKEYHIFDRTLHMTVMGSVNQLWSVCASLTNLQGPLF